MLTRMLRPVPSRPPGPVDPAEAVRHVAAELPALDALAAAALALVDLAGQNRASVASERELSPEELGLALARARTALRRAMHPLPGSGWCARMPSGCSPTVSTASWAIWARPAWPPTWPTASAASNTSAASRRPRTAWSPASSRQPSRGGRCNTGGGAGRDPPALSVVKQPAELLAAACSRPRRRARPAPRTHPDAPRLAGMGHAANARAGAGDNAARRGRAAGSVGALARRGLLSPTARLRQQHARRRAKPRVARAPRGSPRPGS